MTQAEGAHYRALSLWWDGLDGDIVARPALSADLDVDVVVVGAGFTGLWTAHSLLAAEPGLRVALLEAQVAGYGASGRNGGWCSALFSASDRRLAREHGDAAARSMRRAMQATVDVVGETAAAEGIDCRFEKGGTIVAARNPAQLTRARQELAAARRFGLSADDLRWLDSDEAAGRLGIDGVLGATFTPHCAALDPARLARGLADAVERRGAALYERTPVLRIEPGSASKRPIARTQEGSVRADVVVSAIEAWRATMPAERRSVVPLYSLMIATEPLGASFWSDGRLGNRETFSDHRHLIVYGQRTADGRLAFGGRGAPYHFGSAVRDDFDREPAVHQALRSSLVELFPELAGVAVTHAWGGPLGVPRDWFSSVGLDVSSGMAWAGGYVGDGVSTANLAGRTLADLILRRESDLVALPWVGHRSRRWEPEPLRWLGINAALAATRFADRTERLRGRPSRVATRIERLVGH
ncbi:MAG TPA: FAD-dependent oxidoreductase [Acidimicrobiales bacterium]|nr:FAD-dependent oxidoreductase [Acidimicrobiales bacterium]